MARLKSKDGYTWEMKKLSHFSPLGDAVPVTLMSPQWGVSFMSRCFSCLLHQFLVVVQGCSVWLEANLKSWCVLRSSPKVLCWKRWDLIDCRFARVFVYQLVSNEVSSAVCGILCLKAQVGNLLKHYRHHHLSHSVFIGLIIIRRTRWYI